MQNSFLELRCKFLRLLKSCPPSLKIEPHYPAACSRLNGNCPWPRLIIDNLEEAVSLFDLYNHDLPSLRAAAYRPSEQAKQMRENGRAAMLRETFSVDATIADHAGAELADHVERLLGEIEALVADAHQQARHRESD